jgi:hypothetical protein
MLLVLVTAGLWIVAQVLLDAAAKTKVRKMLSPTCACPGWAVDFRGWQGTIKTFNFLSAPYLAEFALANARTLVNVRPDLLQLLERYEQNQKSAPTTARAKPSVAAAPKEIAPSEESVVINILADIEAARGPASRRATLDRGLKRVTSPDLRAELLTRAAQLETRAVLDKVDSLKSKAAKRRHLEEGLASLKSDAVDDDLQHREIALLEEALRELG